MNTFDIVYLVGYFLSFLLSLDLAITDEKGKLSISEDMISPFIFAILMGLFSWGFVLFYIVIKSASRNYK